MAQAANCGSSPAALNNVQDLSAVNGQCGVQEESIESTSATQVPSTGVNNADAGAVPTSTGRIVSQPSGATSQTGPRPISENSGRSLGAPGLTWSLGIMF